MYLSNYFLPILKENPSEATIISHRLMLRAGMVRQLSAGMYSWLPLGLKVLNKVAEIVRKNMNAAGAVELLMPCLQPAELWQESGRYEAYGKEMLRIKDRHERDILFGPTNEEVVTDIFRQNIKTYKELPKCFYQVQWKFRDEIRPRFGVMRGREFLMKDAYSFDIDKESAVQSYNNMYAAYFNAFRDMGLYCIAVKADSGPIGGDLSQEFHVIADTGESAIYYDAILDQLMSTGNFDIEQMRSLYAAADEKHDPATCPVPPERLVMRRGIEVGHIFYIGSDKYSKTMNSTVTGKNGEKLYPEMGCYGIGISRLVGAIIEANHDDRGIVWPLEVAPFKVSLLNLRVGDEACDALANQAYATLTAEQIDVLYDDTTESAGSKFATHDLIGSPWQIIVGPKLAGTGSLELKNRRDGNKQELSLQQAITLIKGQ